MAQDRKLNGIMQTYVQYSKRITLFAMIQWCALAGTSLLIVIVSMLFQFPLGEALEAIVRGVVTWSSSLAIASVGTYQVNSIFEKQFKSSLEAEMAKANIKTDIAEEAGGNG